MGVRLISPQGAEIKTCLGFSVLGVQGVSVGPHVGNASPSRMEGS